MTKRLDPERDLKLESPDLRKSGGIDSTDLPHIDGRSYVSNADKKHPSWPMHIELINHGDVSITACGLKITPTKRTIEQPHYVCHRCFEKVENARGQSF